MRRFFFVMAVVFCQTIVAGEELPKFVKCESATWTSDHVGEGFRHKRNAFMALWGANHTASDVLAVQKEDAAVNGRFSYGLGWKALFDEKIEIWIDDCHGKFAKLGETLTNDDGRIEFKPVSWPANGRYAIVLRVAGDSSITKSVLTVVPKNTRLVVFDIDGTLTNAAVSERAREGAADATQLLYGQGYEIIYLTARHYVLTDRTRYWLKSQGMAPGTILLAQSWDDISSKPESAGRYKSTHLIDFRRKGMFLDSAYGDQESDIFAYEKAEIDKSKTYILGGNGGKNGTIGLGRDYVAHIMSDLSRRTPIEQPFERL